MCEFLLISMAKCMHKAISVLVAACDECSSGHENEDWVKMHHYITELEQKVFVFSFEAKCDFQILSKHMQQTSSNKKTCHSQAVWFNLKSSQHQTWL